MVGWSASRGWHRVAGISWCLAVISHSDGQTRTDDCVAMAEVMNQQCCERTPELCGSGATPSLCTPDCSPTFIDFWISSCHDSVLQGGATFQAELDQLMAQCLFTSAGSRDRAAVPEMVHLSRAGAGAEHTDAVVVTWQTAEATPGSDVGFRAVGVPGAGWRWTSAAAGGVPTGATRPQPSSYRNARLRYQSGTVHRVVVHGLRPGVLYNYRVGDRRMAEADPGVCVCVCVCACVCHFPSAPD